MNLVSCFRPEQSCRKFSVLSDFGLCNISSVNRFLSPPTNLHFRRNLKFSILTHAKKKNKKTSLVEPKQNNFFEEEEEEEEEEQVLLEDILKEVLTNDEDEDEDYYLDEDEAFEEEEELYVSLSTYGLTLKYLMYGLYCLKAGDGSGGGGIKLAGTIWDKEALSLAEKVCEESFNGELGIYAFKTLPNSTVQVRIERLTNKYGSPTLEDIETYSKLYRGKLADAEQAKTIPDNISLEVSSHGVARVVRIPQDLDRYKERPMYVRYVNEERETEGDGIFRLVSFDVEARRCVWGIADIRVNREKAGKGRPLSKKQREWRLDTSFESLRLVRIPSEC